MRVVGFNRVEIEHLGPRTARRFQCAGRSEFLFDRLVDRTPTVARTGV